MFCRNCGKELANDARFCSKCRTAVYPSDDYESKTIPNSGINYHAIFWGLLVVCIISLFLPFLKIYDVIQYSEVSELFLFQVCIAVIDALYTVHYPGNKKPEPPIDKLIPVYTIIGAAIIIMLIGIVVIIMTLKSYFKYDFNDKSRQNKTFKLLLYSLLISVLQIIQIFLFTLYYKIEISPEFTFTKGFWIVCIALLTAEIIVNVIVHNNKK